MGFFSDINSVLGNLAPYNDAAGLLDPREAQAAKQQALLTQAGSLLQAGGPSPYPVSFGQALGSAVMRGQAAQNAAIDDSLKRKLVASEIMARMAPPDRKVITVATPQGPRLMYEQDAMRLGLAPYNPNSEITPYQRESLKIQQQNADREGSVTPAIQAQLNMEQKRIDAEAASRAQAAADKANAPLTPEQLNALMGPDGKPLPYGTTAQGAQLAGAMPTTADQQKQKAAIANAKNTVDQLEKLAFGPDGKSGVFSGNGGSIFTDNPVARAALGASNKFGETFWGSNPDAVARQTYTNTAQGVLAPIVRALGDSGALSDTDIKRANSLIPHLGALPQSEEAARAQFGELRQLISKGVEAYQTQSGGSSTAGRIDFGNGVTGVWQ